MFKLHTRRATYHWIQYCILGIEAFFGWRAGEFYWNLFGSLANPIALFIVCLAVGLVIGGLGFALSTHYRYAMDAAVEFARQRRSARNEGWMRIISGVIMGMAILLIVAHDVAGAVYLGLEAQITSPDRLAIAITALCSLVALPFLVGYFMPGLAASLPAEEKQEFVAAVLTHSWRAARNEYETYVAKKLLLQEKQLNNRQVPPDEEVLQRVMSMLASLYDGRETQQLLHLAGYPGTRAQPAISVAPTLAEVSEPGSGPFAAPLPTQGRPQQPADHLPEALTLEKAAELLDEEDIAWLEQVCQEHGITIESRKNGWLGRKKFYLSQQALLKLAAALGKPLEQAEAHSLQMNGAELQRPVGQPVSNGSHALGPNDYPTASAAAQSSSMLSPHEAEPGRVSTAATGAPVSGPSQAAQIVGASGTLLVRAEPAEKPTRVRPGIAYGFIPLEYSAVTLAECAVVTDYSVGYLGRLRREGKLAQTETRHIPASEALRLYQLRQQQMRGTGAATTQEVPIVETTAVN